jgi:hypothetical protein
MNSREIEVSGQSHASTALPRGEGASIPHLIRDGGTPKLFLMISRKEKYVSSYWHIFVRLPS